jgi:hypothetical protein
MVKGTGCSSHCSSATCHFWDHKIDGRVIFIPFVSLDFFNRQIEVLYLTKLFGNFFHQTSTSLDYQMTTQGGERVEVSIEVVSAVVCPHKGAARSLLSRTKQLYNTVYALKQHIFFLRNTSRACIESHDTSTHQLGLLDCMNPNPTVQEDTGPEVNPLLTNDGLGILINELKSSDAVIAQSLEQQISPQLSFAESISQLDDYREDINISLGKSRLGKAHQNQEDKLCETAKELNRTIAALHGACENLYSPEPSCDPNVLSRIAEYRMDLYLKKENEYARRCLMEQHMEKELEKLVFTVLQQLPLEHEAILSPIMDKCNEALRKVNEKAKSFHPLTDWTTFESRHAEQFAPDNLKITMLRAENHPDDEQFLQYQEICQPDLEIYQKLRHTLPPSDETKISRGQKLVKSIQCAKAAITPATCGYAIRGSWSISSGGYLMEYDDQQHVVRRMFNLRKCELGDLAPDESQEHGYFTIIGQRIKPSSKKTKLGRKKIYKFRARWENARGLIETLKRYCTSVEGAQHTAEDDAALSLSLSSLSGDTIVGV